MEGEGSENQALTGGCARRHDEIFTASEGLKGVGLVRPQLAIALLENPVEVPANSRVPQKPRYRAMEGWAARQIETFNGGNHITGEQLVQGVEHETFDWNVGLGPSRQTNEE